MNNKENFGKEIKVKGFVDSLRDLQYVQFLIIRNGKEKLQVTLEKEDKDMKDLVPLVSEITLESTVEIKGVLKENKKVKLNGMELIPKSINVTSTSKRELPLNIKDKDSSLRETRLDYRFLDLRREENLLLFKAQTTLLAAMREYWVDNDFIEINTPKISKSAAESGAEVFKIDYFGEEACLSQSPQFYKQMAMAAGFGKVFEIAPAFRAENSHTSYHATEIQMVDSEISFIDSVEDVMEMQEKWITYSLNKLIEKLGKEIKETMNIEISKVENKFPRITLKEAKEIIKEEYNYVSERKDDLERKEEEFICKWAKKNHNSDFIFITKWPFDARPFYHMKDKDGFSDSFDLLYKGLEITTGSQREHRYDVLKKQMIEKGINPKDLDFYLQFFEFGCPPHGGFGFGLSRLMMQIFEIDNIREATFIYRGPTRLNP